MIDCKSVLAVIPARGGSKGVPRKNLVNVSGKPLIAWTIEAARASKLIDRVILSSEDEEIMKVVRDLGCDVPFARPAELALDSTPCTETVIHAISVLEGYDYVVLLQPTSPLRTTDDIDTGIRLCAEDGVNSCVSFTPLVKPFEWLFDMGDDMCPIRLAQTNFLGQRQDGRTLYYPNGAVYVARVDWLLQQRSFYGPGFRAFVMPVERSLDIDTAHDVVLAEQLIRANGT